MSALALGVALALYLGLGACWMWDVERRHGQGRDAWRARPLTEPAFLVSVLVWPLLALLVMGFAVAYWLGGWRGRP